MKSNFVLNTEIHELISNGVHLDVQAFIHIKVFEQLS